MLLLQRLLRQRSLPSVAEHVDDLHDGEDVGGEDRDGYYYYYAQYNRDMEDDN